MSSVCGNFLGYADGARGFEGSRCGRVQKGKGGAVAVASDGGVMSGERVDGAKDAQLTRRRLAAAVNELTLRSEEMRLLAR